MNMNIKQKLNGRQQEKIYLRCMELRTNIKIFQKIVTEINYIMNISQ